MLKKIPLLTFLLFITGNVALADMFNETFYIRGDIIGNKFENTAYYTTREKFGLKSKENVALGLGIGYNFFSGLRSEIVASHHLPIEFIDQYDKRDHVRASISSLLLRMAYDVMDLDEIRLFAGFGVGAARVKHKTNTSFTGASIPYNDGNSSKPKNNFAYNLFLGSSYQMSDNVFLELGYMYADYGNTNKYKLTTSIGRIGLKSKNVFLGFRLDF